MGAPLAACLGGEVFWASEGRSEASAARAKEAGIVDVGSVPSLVAAVDAVVSVCPPAAAIEIAEQVSGLGFDGLYVDVNAVSPGTTRRIARLFSRFVDGGIVGPPPAPSAPVNVDKPARGHAESHAEDRSGGTRLYLSGREASDVAAWFAESPVDAHVIGSEHGQASALKMAYAAWTKGTSALLLSVAALATSEGVAEELMDEWDMSIPEVRNRLEEVSGRIGKKAWRFAGEMEEIASAYGDAGLPDGFHLAAANVYSRLADLKDHPQDHLPDEIVKMLLDRPASRSDASQS